MGIHKARLERWRRYREYKAEGHSMKEVAEHFGISEATAVAACKGIAPQKLRPGVDFAAKNQYTSGFDREANARRYIANRTPGFEYAGNFTGVDGYVDLRCKKCGAVIRKSFVSVRHGSASCDNCKAIEIEAKRKEREAARLERSRLREEGLERKAAENELKQKEKEHACPVCGTITERRVYCSKECANKSANATRDLRRRHRVSAAIVDRGITLERLYDEAGGVCYLCGGVCDWNDKEERAGAVVCGEAYPSVDHVLPLSRGGKHAWDNVRLAHRGCNTKKGTALYPLMP